MKKININKKRSLMFVAVFLLGVLAASGGFTVLAQSITPPNIQIDGLPAAFDYTIQKVGSYYGAIAADGSLKYPALLPSDTASQVAAVHPQTVRFLGTFTNWGAEVNFGDNCTIYAYGAKFFCDSATVAGMIGIGSNSKILGGYFNGGYYGSVWAGPGSVGMLHIGDYAEYSIIKDVEVCYYRGVGVHMGDGGDTCSLVDSFIHNGGMDGVYVGAQDNDTVSGCTFKTIWDTGVTVESGADRTNVHDNFFGYMPHAVCLRAYGTIAYDNRAVNNIIYDCFPASSSAGVLDVSNNKQAILQGNTMRKIQGAGITERDTADGNVYRDNMFIAFSLSGRGYIECGSSAVISGNLPDFINAKTDRVDFHDDFFYSELPNATWGTDGVGNRGTTTMLQTTPAIVVLTTGTTLYDARWIGWGGASGMNYPLGTYMDGTKDWSVEIRFRTTSASNYQFTFQVARDDDNRIGMFVESDLGATTQLYCKASGTATNQVGSYTHDTNWHVFRIEKSTDQVTFYVDGTINGYITTNIPTGNLGLMFWEMTLTTAAKTAYVDYVTATSTR